MNKKKLHITLPQPCQEAWNNMEETQLGRFCNSCQKEVIDFTKMTDSEMLHFVKNNGYHFCGSFLSSQLNRPIVAPKQPSIFNYKKIAAGVFALLSFEAANAQSSQKSDDKKIVAPTGNTDDKKANTIVTEYNISGDVSLHLDKKELANVTIKIGNNPKVYTTDASGHFNITLTENEISTYTIISFDHPSLKREVRSIFKTGFPVVLKVYLDFPPDGRMGGMPVFQ